jgi:hypothetical protein
MIENYILGWYFVSRDISRLHNAQYYFSMDHYIESDILFR